MLARDERRFRYPECLELEALHEQFAPCEAYADAGPRGRQPPVRTSPCACAGHSVADGLASHSARNDADIVRK
jgi:hypothetical protein